MREDDRGRVVPGNRPGHGRGRPPVVDPGCLRVVADREQAGADQLRGGVLTREADSILQSPGAHY